MNVNYLIRVVVIILCWLSVKTSNGKTLPDSVIIEDTLLMKETDAKIFKPTQLIVPASLVTIGALGLCNNWIKDVNNSVRQEIGAARGDNYFQIDDYLQYLPVASYLGAEYVGAKTKHSITERVCVAATSYIAMTIMVNVTKTLVNSPRPDTGATNSFPSGHTATVFTGAELMRLEYNTGIGIGAYAVACGVGFMRIWNDRHWLTDVIAGAGVGILSARIGYWLLPVWQKVFKLQENKTAISIVPYYYDQSFGAAMAMVF